MPPQKNRRFPLLLYKRYHELRSGFGKFLIVLGLLGLAGLAGIKLFVNPDMEAGTLQGVLTICLALVIFGMLQLLYTIMVSKTGYAECRPRSLKVQTPFFPLVVSYKRIKETRTTMLRDVFPPEHHRKARELLEKYWGETVICARVSKWSVPLGILKLIVGQYLFDPKGNELVLLVDDWMTFSRQLDQSISDYNSQGRTPAAQRGYRTGH
jgi:hypothetical protein